MKLKNEIIQPLLVSRDPIGKLFFHKGRILRIINPESTGQAKKLLESGLIDELSNSGLFPITSVVKDLKFGDAELILEHERIPFVTLPSEWSFSMLKTAAMTFLKICLVAKKYGYYLKDGHLHNIAFAGFQPVFLDFGSFSQDKDNGSALAEFFEHAVLPLKLWAKGDFYLANLILRDVYSHLRYLPAKRLSSHRTLRKEVPLLERPAANFCRRAINYLFSKIVKKKVMSSSSLSVDQLIKLIKPLEKPKIESVWENYHNEYFKLGKLEVTGRMKRITSILEGLGIESFIDLAGNKGILSLYAAENTSISRILSTDYDENAVDGLFAILQKRVEKKVTPMLLNFTLPVEEHFFPIQQRVRCDMAIAMAVTHHLILSQGFPIEYILKTVGNYTNKYVLIEFMPLGLWDGMSSTSVPDWYNLCWFRHHFQNEYDCILEEKLEENRIVFLGSKKNGKIQNE